MKPNQPGMLNYLRVISQDPSLDLNIRDVEGWTVLRRAAAFGTSEEVMELVRLGADPADLSSSLSWTALFYAAHFGNWNTFRALLSLETGPIEDIVDARGYTLLHVVASEGQEDIMRTLMEAGVDPSRACRPSIRPGVPQELYGRACTAGEVAAAAGLGILRAYIDVLGDRVDEGLRNVELPDDLEIYWDAETVVVDQSA
jgi:ankyrin repeat protein